MLIRDSRIDAGTLRRLSDSKRPPETWGHVSPIPLSLVPLRKFALISINPFGAGIGRLSPSRKGKSAAFRRPLLPPQPIDTTDQVSAAAPEQRDCLEPKRNSVVLPLEGSQFAVASV